MGVQERARNREQVDKNKTIKNQSKVIKDMWSELQQLKRILIDDHPTPRLAYSKRLCSGV